MSLVSVDGVACERGGRVVLRDVSFELSAGQVLGILGPNGGGKSTLIRLLAGVLSPSQGTIRVDGEPVASVARRGTGDIGLVGSKAGLYPLLTGLENLAFFGALVGLEAAEVSQRSRAVAQRIGLPLAALDRPVSQASSGTLQKLALVRALMVQPRVLLLDEPTSHLDPMAAEALWGAVRELVGRDLAIVLVTHDLSAALALSDTVAWLDGSWQGAAARSEEPTPERWLARWRGAR